MKRVFDVLTFLLLPAVVCAAEPVAVPSAPFLDYFAGRGYVFEKFEGMCPLALATYILEANRFAGTLVVTECRQKLFHNLFFTVYRDLDADKVKESLKDVRHVFMQAAGETPAMERWLNRCIGAGQSGDKYRVDGYSYYCAADEDTYLFTMSAEEEHDHPSVKVAKKPKCMTQKAYEDMIRRRLLERARFAGRMDDYYLLYPEDRPQRIVDPAERYRSGYLRSKEAARERGVKHRRKKRSGSKEQ